MAKKVTAKIKVQITGGQATPAPPVGPALGAHGVTIRQSLSRINEPTRDRMGIVLPVEIFVYHDHSFTFNVKTSPAAVQLRKAADIEKGSPNSIQEKVGTVTRAQLEEIAKNKMEDLNTNDLDAAVRIIAGTARNMGIEVEA